MEITMERTLVFLKPDAVKRKLMGEIITRFEKRDLKIVDVRMIKLTREIAEQHYSHVKNESIYDDMIEYITSGPILAMIIEGENVIKIVRDMVGHRKTYHSPPGTIRGDFGSHDFENLIHASDSPESAEIEIKRFFEK
jgi:nucleoside-diphosphate kinase